MAVAEDTERGTETLASELIDAFIRLARGDFSVRLERNYRRDTADTLAYFVNLLAEEMGRIFKGSEAQRRRLETGVDELNQLFARVAAGDFSTRSGRDRSNDPLDMLGFHFDETVAALGRSFAAIEQQKATNEAIVSSMADGLLMLSASGVVVRCNRAASDVLGRRQRDLQGARLDDLLAPRDRKFSAEIVAAGARAVRGRDTHFLTGTGETVVLRLSCAPMYDAGGDRIGTVLTARDESALRQAQARLQLSDRMATMGTLAAGVAHEINNPLSFVISNLEFVLEELDEHRAGEPLEAELLDELKHALATSKQGAERVARIVRDLKSISRVDTDSAEEVPPQRILDSAASMLKNEIRHRARLIKSYDDTPPVSVNEARLMQVALNLLQNAAHAIPIGKVSEHEIRVRTGVDDAGWVVIEVSDTGEGIPEDRRDSIFEAFYTTKPMGMGTGLGLSICKRLVAQMNGRIEVESAEGQGSTFRVLLPPASVTESRDPSREMRLPGSGRRRRILVVDDEREIGESVQRLLGNDHDVDVATSGAEALERHGRQSYELILVDLMMPEMSGRELKAVLRQRFPDHGVRVVLMSGGSLDTPGQTVSEVHLEKPFSPSALRALIAQLDWVE